MNAKPDSLKDLVDRHPRIALDSNVLIYLLEGRDHRAEVAGRLVDAIGTGTVRGVLASIALSEIIVRPARLGDLALVERYREEITSVENLTVVAISADVAVEAGLIRARTNVDIVDALHLACAHAGGATVLVTNDRAIPPTPGLAVVYLDDLDD